MKELRLSLLSDPATIQFKDFFSENKDAEIIKMANEAGIITLNIRYSKPIDLPAGTKLLSVVYDKKSDKKTVINLAETVFATANGVYELSNAPLEF